MTDEMVNEKIKSLRSYKRAAEELQHNISALEEELKEELERRGVEEIVTADYKVSWKTVSSTRLDTKALKAERPEIYARYAVTSGSKRFLVQ